MKQAVADCLECGRTVGLVFPYHSRTERAKLPRIATHGIHDKVKKGEKNPRCTYGTGAEVLPEQIYYRNNTRQH